MVSPDVEKRCCIHDVFSSPAFTKLDYNIPMPGRCIATHQHSFPISKSNHNDECFKEMLKNAILSLQQAPACIFFMLHVFANCLSDKFSHIYPSEVTMSPDKDRLQAEYATVFAAKMTSMYYSHPAVNTVVQGLKYNIHPKHTNYMIEKYLKTVNGHIRVVNWFDKALSQYEAENALLWLIQVCIGEKTYEDPNSCHYNFCVNETFSQRLSRVPKTKGLSRAFVDVVMDTYCN